MITTPFSFVATTHSLHWNGITPVFADIDPETFNLDPHRVEAAITPSTTAIMPVHVYGRPCEVDAIQKMADTYGFKVIYDAAHAFGVRLNGQSVLNFGDMSVSASMPPRSSTRSRAVRSSVAIFATKQRIDFLKNFGFADEVTVVAPGINGKMNELQAAFGLLQLKHIRAAHDRRRIIDWRYREVLSAVEGIHLPSYPQGVDQNYSYFPILVRDRYSLTRDALYQEMRRLGIYARRYFYPLISEFPTYRGLRSSGADNLPCATRLAQEVLCLPIYPALTEEEQDRVIAAILPR